MDGFRGSDQRHLDSGVVVEVRDEPVSQPIEPDEDDSESEPSFFSKWTLPVVLFLLTVFSTLWAGAYQVYNGPARGPLNFLLTSPETFWQGIPFAGALLFILTTHELGHYVLSKIHRVPASLPLFIPGLPRFIGTFGAIIRMRGPILSRRALFDIGVAGPLAGLWSRLSRCSSD